MISSDQRISQLELQVEELQKQLALEIESKNRAYSERNYAAILAARATAHFGAAPYAPKCGWYLDNTKPEWKVVVTLTGDTGKQVSWHMSPNEAELAKTNLLEVEPNWDGTFLSKEAESIAVVGYNPLHYKYGQLEDMARSFLWENPNAAYSKIVEDLMEFFPKFKTEEVEEVLDTVLLEGLKDD